MHQLSCQGSHDQLDGSGEPGGFLVRLACGQLSAMTFHDGLLMSISQRDSFPRMQMI